MRKIVLILLLTIIAVSPAAAQSIITALELQMAERRLGGDEDLNIPLSGQVSGKAAKSRFLAGLYSLILPGAGQYYSGNVFKTKLYAGIESGLWISFYGFRKFGKMKSEASRGWAVLHAGASPYNDDDRYWTKLTYYDNRDSNEPDGFGYNQMIRVIDRDEALIFPETPDYYWNWDSRQSREHYRKLRNQSKTAYRRADLVIGGVIVNHLVSAIDAFISAGKFNRRLGFSGIDLDCRYYTGSGASTFYLGLSKQFN